MEENLKYTGKIGTPTGLPIFFMALCYAKKLGETVCMQLNYIHGGTYYVFSDGTS